MGRPPLSDTEKIESVRHRLILNTRMTTQNDCWEHTGQEFYKMGRNRRLKPRSVMWLVAGKQLPEPPHKYYIGQLDTCTVEVCVNPRHLEIKDNSSKAEERQMQKAQEFATAQGGVLRGDPPDGAVWGEGTEVIWLDLDKWEAAARAKGKDDAWVEHTRPKILERAAAHRG